MIRFFMEGRSGVEPVIEIGRGGVITISAIVVALVLALYVLRSIGVFVLAKKQGIKCAFLAWIPFVWLYPVCKIIGKIRTFGSTFSKLALAFTIIFALAEILTLTYNVLVYYPLIGNVLLGGKQVYIADGTQEAYSYFTSVLNLQEYWTGGIFYDATFVWPYSAQTDHAISVFSNVVYYVSFILDIASVVITINVYIALFRKFWPQHFILASILSFFGLFPIFVFVIRNKKEINYAEYMRSRYQAHYSVYGNPYGNPYGAPPQNQGNPYGNQPRQPEHPFSEFAERGEVDPGNPFKEFSDKANEPFSEYDQKDKDEK